MLAHPWEYLNGMDQFTSNFRASSFRRLTGRWWASSTISCSKATYQERSHGQSGRHWRVRQLLKASPSSLTASQASSCSLCCYLSDQLLRAGPIFEVHGPAMVHKQQQHQAQHALGQEAKETVHKLFQLCFKRLGSSSPSFPLAPSIKALHAEQRLLGPSFS